MFFLIYPPDDNSGLQLLQLSSILCSLTVNLCVVKNQGKDKEKWLAFADLCEMHLMPICRMLKVLKLKWGFVMILSHNTALQH